MVSRTVAVVASAAVVGVLFLAIFLPVYLTQRESPGDPTTGTEATLTPDEIFYRDVKDEERSACHQNPTFFFKISRKA